MSRIEPLSIDQLGPLRGTFEDASDILGFVPTDGLLMAHRHSMMQASNDLIWAVLQGGSLDPGLKRLVGFVSSTVSGCQYCAAHTSFTAMKYGVAEEKLKAVWSFKTSDLFTPAEKAALQLAMHGSTNPNAATDADFELLKNHYSDAEIVELVFTMSTYAFLNRFNDTLQTPVEDAPAKLYESIKKIKP